MPIYEYMCGKCKVTFQFLVRNVVTHEVPTCPRCGGRDMRRAMSRFATPKGEERRMDDLSDPSNLPDVDSEDPRAMARWMRKMSEETGESMGPEFDEVLQRLERGEDPEKIEEEMGDLLEDGSDGGGLGGGGGYDSTLYEG
jgi:putative FmdB family regulatory protein